MGFVDKGWIFGGLEESDGVSIIIIKNTLKLGRNQYRILNVQTPSEAIALPFIILNIFIVIIKATH